MARSEALSTGAAAPCLWEPLDRGARRSDLLLCWQEDGYQSWSWHTWYERSVRLASGLRRIGVDPGERVACLLSNSSAACAAVLGTWLAGACLLSLPLISRGMNGAEYVRMLRRILDRAQPAVLLCDEHLAAQLNASDLGIKVLGFENVDGPMPYEPTPPGADEPAFVQFSSGSTTDPRGCVLSPGAIAAQLGALQATLEIDPERDTGVVWLPLAHDMGLFGCLLLTYWTGHRLVLGTPQRFIANPRTWFDDCAVFQATVSATPNFGLDLATRVAQARLPDPFPIRRMVIGGERVEPNTLRRANAVLGDERLPMRSLLPAYGLAEAVLAVTASPIDRGPKIVEVEMDALAAGEVAVAEPAGQGVRTVALTSCGPPLAGNEVDAGSDGAVGEVVVRTPTQAMGYLDAPELSAERFTEDGIVTGDLGFRLGAEVFITGRRDDLISVGGRNVYARDIEAAISAVRGVRPGSCAVVEGLPDHGGKIVVLAELRDHHSDVHVIAAEIQAAARAAAGTRIDECQFLPRGCIAKTPSGKLKRFRCREMAAAQPPGAIRVAL